MNDLVMMEASNRDEVPCPEERDCTQLTRSSSEEAETKGKSCSMLSKEGVEMAMETEEEELDEELEEAETSYVRDTKSIALTLLATLGVFFVLVTTALMLFLVLFVPRRDADANIEANVKTYTPNLMMEGRCFEMCEPDELFFRTDKLLKPVVAHDGIEPTRFFLYLFPPEPEFDVEEVGHPLFLTPLIKSRRLDEARELARVRGLQWPHLISFSGFLTVNEKFNSNLFFWFFPSQSNPDSDPLILWLQGGPGATSLFGQFRENGPIFATLDRERKLPIAHLNRFAWNRNASLIYIDNPVGAGFSFTDDVRGYPSSIEQSTEDLFEGLQQFFTLFHQLATLDFYVFGESYGGKYAPGLSHRILNARSEDRINIRLSGIGVGNGWMSPVHQGKYANFLFFHGLIDGAQYMTLKGLEDRVIHLISSGRWREAWMASDDQLQFILVSLNFSSLYDLTHGQFSPETMDFWHYLQQPQVRRSLHLGNRTLSDGVDIYKAMVDDTMQSSLPNLVEAMERIKVLLYHGALDIICHFPGAEEMLAAANWSSKEQYHNSQRRALWFHNDDKGVRELAGYVKGEGRLRMLLMRNAGHSAPMDQGQRSLRMIEAFINDTL